MNKWGNVSFREGIIILSAALASGCSSTVAGKNWIVMTLVKWKPSHKVLKFGGGQIKKLSNGIPLHFIK